MGPGLGRSHNLHISNSSRLGVASSMFCTMSHVEYLLARDPLLDRINALLPLQGLQELTMAQGDW